MPESVRLLVTVGGSVALALVIVEIVHRALQRFAHSGRMYRPGQLFGAVLAAQISLSVSKTTGEWKSPVLHVLGVVLIAAGAWLLVAFVTTMEDVALAKIPTNVTDNRHARKVHTQITLVRRVATVVIGVLAIGAVLMTFPSVRAIGTTVLASAGVIGAVAALAAQSLLGNVIAGVQIAFSDAIRLEDVVVVEEQWGRVEEITLTYVVVHLWDDRRMIMPTSYFLKTPFENWTRTQSALLGTIELDVDWSVSVEQMRHELRDMLEHNDLWDGRVCVLQVVDATWGRVRTRALISAPDAGKLWDLRCLVREHLVDWVRHNNAMPQVRTQNAGRSPVKPREQRDQHTDARVFGDSPDGQQRDEVFSGPRAT
ncbi:mechanosensitive ion channel protein MscS [Lentzea sp. NBRC 105346]|uniref:mechanosensitive ion channel family protein n=1 Tax=Lentzea sp. NBRC 105346 TaxID=3032205 RepID=UPI0024A14712|nr:mechanosensitive ion channel domain-containing protein [Lentzea sp. NBRC 105346]GLZ29988.1 mechanosensitive ion channel protein MscS [Lentzea sp. NBRC 105346]